MQMTKTKRISLVKDICSAIDIVERVFVKFI